MKLYRNSTWKARCALSGTKFRIFRVLAVYPALDTVAIFFLDSKSSTQTPRPFSLQRITILVQEELIKPYDYPLPIEKMLSDAETPTIWKERRKKNYELIKDLVESKTFLPTLLQRKHPSPITAHTLKNNVAASTIYRRLNDYWRFGQTPAALTPGYSRSGAPNRPRPESNKERGRPHSQYKFFENKKKRYRITDKDKQEIRAAIVQFHIKDKITPFTAVYDHYLNQYHKTEIVAAEEQSRPPYVPSIHQFRYWHTQSSDNPSDEKRREGHRNWDMYFRPLLSSVSEHVDGPGDRFEIDATPADVYIVSEYDRSRVLGRPIIYAIIDEASRMVVGIFIGLESTSWDAAKQALLNAFLPKVAYCARFGVFIEEEDWPCHHLPRSLLCDRGELKGNKPSQHLTPMGIDLEFTRKARGDWKSVVESKFNTLNQNTLHLLEGTTKGKPKKYGDPDPRKSARYTLNEITKQIIIDVLEFNKTKHIDDLFHPELLKQGQHLTPLNYWNTFTRKNLDSLTVINPDQARAELLRRYQVTVTRHGFLAEDLYYTCNDVDVTQWFVDAGSNGEYKIEGRLDDTNSSVIYVRQNHTSPLLKCHLLPKHKHFQDLYRDDVIYIQEWKAMKKNSGPELAGTMRRIDAKNKMKKYAHKDRIDTSGTFKMKPNTITKLREAREIEKSPPTGSGNTSTEKSQAITPDDDYSGIIDDYLGDPE